ncbi:MAG: hypothetical protein AABX40_05815 [Candidatus Hydrothermarchaeota archaeon]
MPEEDLLEFYGTECVHCKVVEPLIEKLRAEERIEIQRLEVWHNEKNAALMRQLDKGYCGGVPFFYNKRTGKWLCGSVDYETLRRWAQGK